MKPTQTTPSAEKAPGPPSNGRATRSPVIVSGMHRSGTSFVSSLLLAAGLDMGERLMAAARGNERGHFENMDFVEFHMRWLRLTGHDDSGWAAVQTLTLPEEATAEARSIIDENARSAGWGWKDPRTTLFLDFWANIAPEARFVFIYREPSEVVDSLFRRGDNAIKLTPELAAQAYITHNNLISRFAQAHRDRSVIANVSAVARDPERFLTMVAQKFGLHLDVKAPSPFDAELTKKMELDSPRPTLLRYVVPEIERLYADLERQADLPSEVPPDNLVSPSLARGAFFNEWFLAGERDAAAIGQEREAAQRAFDFEGSGLRSEIDRITVQYQNAVDQIESLNAERVAVRNETALLVQHEKHLSAKSRDTQVLLDASQTRVRELATELETMMKRNAQMVSRVELDALRRQLDVQQMQIADGERCLAEIRDRERQLDETVSKALDRAQQLEAELSSVRGQASHYEFLLREMRNSRFWRMRNAWFGVKNWFGVRTDIQ